MNINWADAFLFPLIMLLTEYLVIQPILQSRGRKELKEATTEKSNFSWGNGIKKAILNFKSLNNSFRWQGISLKQDFIKIKQFSTYRGQADITLSIFERYRFTLYQREIARFRLISDRVGDIRSSDELLIKKSSGNVLGLLFPVGTWAIIAFVFTLASAKIGNFFVNYVAI